MKAVRSSGRGGDLPRGKNGVPALSVGVRNRQDYFKMEQYRGFRIVRMEWTGFRHRKMAGCQEHPNSRKYYLFDWDHDGVSDHVGIVESCDGTTVYTVEGNSGDAVKENSYTVHSASIMGYGIVSGM